MEFNKPGSRQSECTAGKLFRLLALSFLLCLPALAADPAQQLINNGHFEKMVMDSNIVSFKNFRSEFVIPRNIDVWLPPSYNTKGKRFPVIYMHDGQNLFNPSTSYGGVDWGIDETMSRLIRQDSIREAIVVGIWNTHLRRPEYMPQKPYMEYKSRNPHDTAAISLFEPISSGNYLKFIVTELKPFIDSAFSTLPQKENTFIMGSSMGGLISAYAVCEYSDVFYGAACVSTHWVACRGAVIDYLAENLPAPGKNKFYFDFGTLTLDSLYEPYQKKADEVMRKKGYTEGAGWITKKYEGEEHSEKSWRKRVSVPLIFLLGK